MASYQECTLESASAVELVVALYDGIIRFLSVANDAVQRGDVVARRVAVKRALDIIIHLQARLRMDVGGKPAEALSEFYASVFAQILQASQSASQNKFEHAIGCVRNVRDAWRQVARGPGVGLGPVATRSMTSAGEIRGGESSYAGAQSVGETSWTA